MKHLSSSRFYSARWARRTMAAALLVSGLGCLSPIAQAQPDVNNGPKADNPANRAPRRLRQGDMTPDQLLKENLRRQIQKMGVTDTTTQNAIITYAVPELTARQAIMDKGRQLQTSLRVEALSNAQIAALLNDYQGAIEEDRARRLKAQENLKKSVDLTRMPKVEALLTLLGIYGDGPTIMNGMNLRRAQGNMQRPNAVPPAQTPPVAPAPAKI